MLIEIDYINGTELLSQLKEQGILFRVIQREDDADMVSKALHRAWNLGQTYWYQADSESYSQNRKSDATFAKFEKLVEDTRAVIAP